MFQYVHIHIYIHKYFLIPSFVRSYDFPGGSEFKASACNDGDLGSIPGLGRSPGEGNGNPLSYSCLENPMDGGAWWATVHGVAKSQTRLSDFTHSLTHFVCLFLPSLPRSFPPRSQYVYLFKLIFNSRIIAFQYCVSFCCRAT